MPLYNYFSGERIDFSEPLTSDVIQNLAAYPPIEVLQCSNPISDATWDLLNAEFFSRRPDVQLRLYTFAFEQCDLSFTPRMTNVQRFSADCLMSATGVEHIAEMPNLHSLEIGIYDLESFNFLLNVTPAITELMLGETRSKKPDLQPLTRFKKLTRLYLEGQQKNIEVLADLVALEDITLRSISTPDLSYLRALPRLWSLDIKLGGITDLSALAGMGGIKYLELWQVRELKDIGVISHMLGLQNLFLQSLPLITAIPPLRESRQLRRLLLQNLKGLKDLSELQWAPALEEFILIQGQPQQVEDLLPVLNNPSLRRATAHFGSRRKEQRFAELREARRLANYEYSPFQYT